MKKNKNLIITIITSFFISLNAQEPSFKLEWKNFPINKEIGSIESIIKKDNSFIAVGNKQINKHENCWIGKINNQGLTIWENSQYDGSECSFNEVKSTKDEGFIAIGTSKTSTFDRSKVVIYKYDKNGKTKWSKYYSSGVFTKNFLGRDVAYDEGYAVIPFSNKYLIIGKSQGKSALWLFQIDNKGNKIKQNFIYDLNKANSVIQTDKNHIIIVGKKEKNGNYKAVYAKINIKTMQPVFIKKISNMMGFKSITHLNDNFVIAGYEFDDKSNKSYTIVISINKNGKILWKKEYKQKNEDFNPSKIITDKNSNIYLSVNDFGDSCSILKLYSYGAEQWRYKVNIPSCTNINDIFLQDNNELILTGSHYFNNMLFLKLKEILPFKILWEKTFNNSTKMIGIDKQNQNIYLLSSNKIIILNSKGEKDIIKYRHIKKSKDIHIKDVAISKNKEMYEVGYKGFYGGGLADAYIRKSNQNGKLIWEKTFDFEGSHDYDDIFRNILIEKNNIFIIGNGPGRKQCFVKLDKNGNVISNLSSFSQSLNKLIPYKNGFAAVGFKYDSHFKSLPVFYLFDKKGNLIYKKVYKDLKKYELTDIKSVNDGFILIGSIEKFNKKIQGYYGDIALLKVNNKGKILWKSNFGDRYSDAENDTLILPNKNILIVGVTHSFDSYGDGYIAMVNSKGKLLWKKVIGSGKIEKFNKIFYIGNNQYLIVGEKEDTSGDRKKYTWLMKIQIN